MPQRRSIVDEQLLDIIETYAWHDTVRGGGPAVLGLEPRRHRLFFSEARCGGGRRWVGATLERAQRRLLAQVDV